ncbi:ATP-dependent RNA helicase DbpA [Solilutibacter silvestris]|uniref:Superfamily II DNA and RNA helicase n=1 Tax=Solilutibacter silvestris TaxID=1645665 RepID=A0A2K1PZV3_9GAMM|nr:ATP-dependent RNA helicase DbpA [Lysobacter silvestris]PNS08312.1 Superfamily II DNA and RNA helicase [Lysobacter silvestris]
MTDAAPEFTTLPLKPELFQGLDALGHVRMTPIQAQALPALIEGRDLIAQAPTGSGKTAAFGLALLHRIDPTQAGVQALVLCPTRELADQVGKHIRKLATGIANLKLSIFTGGTALAPQLASLAQHAPQVVVGTPGRVQELMRKRVLDLRSVSVLVLDEADRMLDMGFEDAIREIAGKLPKTRQSLLFSATYPDAIRAIGHGLTHDALEVTVGDIAQRPVIEQLFFEVEPAQKPAALAGLLLQHDPGSAVVFCNMRRDVDDVAASLAHLGFSALPLHGEMEQRDRDEVLVRFANRSCNVLVASDVAARGLDIDDLGAVVNYDFPTDPDTYLHRIGRTGRAGRSGLAMSLCGAREVARVVTMEEQLGIKPRWQRPALASLRPNAAPAAPMVTLRIDAGRTDKLRPGDIVGALTGDAGLPGDAVGKIDVFPTRSYVAIARNHATKALARLQAGKIKGRKFRVRQF